ncbi:M23 family metallopeptidase [Fodinicurvata halophila]|uniref:M23 family metallopeptidase n=1 Tax=Fodinicurvata halophila TaxID=1419723 RepID=UPI00363CEF8D
MVYLSGLVGQEDNAELLQQKTLTVTVESGDTLTKLLTETGVSQKEAYRAIEALKEVFSPRDLRVGQEVKLAFKPESRGLYSIEASDAPPELVSLSLSPNVDEEVEVQKTDADKYATRTHERTFEMVDSSANGTITTSLFEAASKDRVPYNVLSDAVRTLSFDVDFQRDIQRGDEFELLYESYTNEKGEVVKTGEILYVSLKTGGEDLSYYRYETGDGDVDYFNSEGQSARKGLMKTPVDGARVSSGYGMRKHPTQGYTKMHKGVDFAAPTGTPIYAAGDGVVERAGPFSSYGNYIRLRHNNSYQTAYAHLNGLAKGITAGTRVKQGDVIGYVGSTGRSTGPHLHYEVLQDGAHVNPSDIKLPTGRKLAGSELEDFESHMQAIDLRRQDIDTSTQFASREDCEPEADTAKKEAEPSC